MPADPAKPSCAFYAKLEEASSEVAREKLAPRILQEAATWRRPDLDRPLLYRREVNSLYDHILHHPEFPREARSEIASAWADRCTLAPLGMGCSCRPQRAPKSDPLFEKRSSEPYLRVTQESTPPKNWPLPGRIRLIDNLSPPRRPSNIRRA